MTNMQHYMDDIHDLLDGLNEEMEKRMQKVAKWDLQSQKISEETQKLEKFIFDTSNPMEERKEKLKQLAELKAKMRDVAEKKCVLTERNQKTVASVYAKLSELAYHCKCEVEIDNPGCTELREKLFYQSLSAGQPFENHSDAQVHQILQSIPVATGRRNREMSVMTDDSTRSGTPAPGKEKSTKKRGVGRPRNREYKERFQTSLSAFSSARSSIERDCGPKEKQLSKYMRKKQERLRLAGEEEERNRIKSFEVKKEIEVEDFDPFGLSIGRWDVASNEEPVEKADLGPDDERELLDCLMHDFTGLNSLPKGMMEALDVTETGLYSMDMYPPNHNEGTSSATSKNKGDFVQSRSSSSFSSNFKHANAATSSSSSESVEKRKRNMLFGSIPDTSFCGRPRKLTDRVTEMLISNRVKEERHHKQKQREADEYCICGGQNADSDMMVMCENEYCRYKWFHFDCVGLTSAPKSEKWFCSECCILPRH